MLIGEGSKADPFALPFGTRTKRYIPNCSKASYSPTDLGRWKVEHDRTFGSKIRFRSNDASYDCVGMVFAARRTTIDIEWAKTILSDDGYRQISQEEIVVGDVILYRSETELRLPTHVGLISEITKPAIDDVVKRPKQFRVLSKWGPAGEYFHEPDAVPILFGKPAEFWTDRRP